MPDELHDIEDEWQYFCVKDKKFFLEKMMVGIYEMKNLASQDAQMKKHSVMMANTLR
ncbi:MAG: hypothetical protein ACOYVK_13865 [Bacillota bacterium]